MLCLETRLFEMIQLPAMFNSTKVKPSLLINKCNFTTSTIAYDLTAPICSKIFKFNHFESELDVEQFLGNPTILSCNCDKSPFADTFN